MPELKHLFSPLRIGSITVRNRIVSPPYSVGYINGDTIGDRLAYFHAERAKGGIGLIVMSEIVGHPTSRLFHLIAIDRSHLPDLRRITEMVHEHGAKILLQVVHAGRQMSSMYSLRALWAPSAIPCTYTRETPHEMSVEEIKEVEQSSALTAALAQEAGFDGVELHGAHGYLLYEFLSPYSNKRTDDYGGSIENRMRYMNELTDLIRQKCGREFVVGTRTSGDEFTPGGLTLADMQDICRRIEQQGQLDYISVSGANEHGLNISMWLGPDMSYPLGLFVPLAAGIRQVLKKLPVFVAGRINDPIQAEKILADGHADMIAMARETLCDPEFANKAREGRLESIRKCVACDQGCMQRNWRGLDTLCIQNPSAGKEKDWGIGSLTRAAQKKKIVIVGGGPAGMKAAEIAAVRGHDVVLYDKASELGGQVNTLVKVPTREEFGGVTRYLGHRLKELAVKVQLGVEMTPQQILAARPDAVIVATGSVPVKPPLPGVDQANVITAWELLQGKATAGKRVVVVDFGDNHWEFLGTAELLAGQGKEVEMITGQLSVGTDINPLSVGPLYKRLLSKGVTITPLTVLREISGNTVIVRNGLTDVTRRIENVDTIVLVPFKKAVDDLHRALKGKVGELYAIGDCYAPRRVDSAIREGETVARGL